MNITITRLVSVFFHFHAVSSYLLRNFWHSNDPETKVRFFLVESKSHMSPVSCPWYYEHPLKILHSSNKCGFKTKAVHKKTFDWPKPHPFKRTWTEPVQEKRFGLYNPSHSAWPFVPLFYLNNIGESIRSWGFLEPKGTHPRLEIADIPPPRHGTLKGRGLLKSHGLSETPIVWRNTSDTFTPRWLGFKQFSCEQLREVFDGEVRCSCPSRQPACLQPCARLGILVLVSLYSPCPPLRDGGEQTPLK